MARRTLIISGKGGTGKSAITALLGFALTFFGKKVVVIDLDATVSSAQVLLGDDSHAFNLGDILEGNCELESVISNSRYEGLDFVAAPVGKAVPASFYKSGILPLFKKLENYDVVLVDSPAGLEMAEGLARELIDDALIIANPERLCLNGARRASQLLDDLGVAEKRLVINKFNKGAWQKNKIESLDEVIDFVGARLAAVVPFSTNFELVLDDFSKLKRNKRLWGSLMNLANRYEGREAKLLFR